jgi:hypothetical protein
MPSRPPPTPCALLRRARLWFFIKKETAHVSGASDRGAGQGEALFDEYQSKENAKHVARREGECPARLLKWGAAAGRLSHRHSRAARVEDKEETGNRRCTLTRCG